METATAKKRSKTWHLLWILPLLAGFAAALCALFVSYWYQSHFLPGTEILGLDCAYLTPEEAGEALRAAAEAEKLSLTDEEGLVLAELPLADFLEPGTLEELSERIFQEQRTYASLLDWLSREERAYVPPVFRKLEQSRAEEVLRSALYGPGTPGEIAPEDARIEMGETGYTLVPEVEGNSLVLWRCAHALTEAVRQVEDLTAEPPAAEAPGARVGPKMTAEAPLIRNQVSALDAYLGLPVSVDFGGGQVYTLTPEDIWRVSHIALTEDSAECWPEEDAVTELTMELIDRYGVDGVDAKFQRAQETREYIYYRVGDRGWIMDREDLARRVYEALSSEQGAELAPTYDYTWYWQDYYSAYRLGDTFIEISLDNQYLWFFLKGKLVLETPVVTGCVADGDETRRGCFKIAYKERDCVLSGPTWNDHVDYWMPFDDQIGLHDSSWRDEYGGDIYLTDGSHGCVNTPLEAIAMIFDRVISGDRVIVY